jgi:hypothetical protein
MIEDRDGMKRERRRESEDEEGGGKEHSNRQEPTSLQQPLQRRHRTFPLNQQVIDLPHPALTITQLPTANGRTATIG